MQRLALEAGVPTNDILQDPRGVDTAATVTNTATLFEEMVKEWADDRHREPIVLAVSHFYHLPRVKMACAIAIWILYGAILQGRYLFRLTPKHVAVLCVIAFSAAVSVLWGITFVSEKLPA